MRTHLINATCENSELNSYIVKERDLMKLILLSLVVASTPLVAHQINNNNNNNNDLLHQPISDTRVATYFKVPSDFKEAIDQENLHNIKKLLEKPENQRYAQKHDATNSELACNYAARYGSTTTLKEFLTYNAQLANSRVGCDQPWIGYPAIAFAVDGGDTAKVIELLHAGADVNSPVGIVIGVGLSTAEGYSLATRNIPLLNYAISTQASIDMIQCLIDEGADINRFSPLQGYEYKIWTPLMMAAYIGRYELVALLLKMGADKNIQDTCGKKAADYAQLQGYTQIYELLQ